MNLYVLRHAEALPVGGIITRDADRHLSPRGEEDAELMGKVLAHLDPNVDIIVTSPLLRAVETGEIMGKELSDHPIMHVSEHLAPGFSNSALFRELMALSAGSNIVAIGHQPDLSGFISYLIAGSDDAAVAMSAGAIARLIVDASHDHAQLAWLFTPEVVKTLRAGF